MFRAIKNHINYWLEKKMANGTYSMIKMLTIVTLSIVMLLAIMMALLDIGDGDGFFSLFWDLLATAINAWMRSGKLCIVKFACSDYGFISNKYINWHNQ